MTLYFIACVLGQFLQTAAGFGFGILVMAVAGMFLPVTAVASANGLLGPLTNLFFLFRYWRKLNLRLIFWPALSGLVAGTVAIYTIQFIPLTFLRGLLGIALVGLSLYFMPFQKRIHILPTPRNGIIAGACGGLLSGYFSTGGPPLVLYLLSVQDDKETYIVCVQTLYLILSIGNTAGRIASGYVTAEVLQMRAIGLVGAGVGLWLGLKVVDRLNIQLLRIIAYIIIGLSGLWMILNAWVL